VIGKAIVQATYTHSTWPEELSASYMMVDIVDGVRCRVLDLAGIPPMKLHSIPEISS
jgi:hypothetical protein